MKTAMTASSTTLPKVRCPECRGSGTVDSGGHDPDMNWITVPCRLCEGRGRLPSGRCPNCYTKMDRMISLRLEAPGHWTYHKCGFSQIDILVDLGELSAEKERRSMIYALYMLVLIAAAAVLLLYPTVAQVFSIATLALLAYLGCGDYDEYPAHKQGDD